MRKQYIEFKFVEVSYATALVIRSMMKDLSLHVHPKFLQLNGTIESDKMYELIQCIKYDCNRYQLFYQHNGSERGTQITFNGDIHSTLTLCDGDYMIDLGQAVQMIKDCKTNELCDIDDMVSRGVDKIFDRALSFNYEFTYLFENVDDVTFYDGDDVEI